MKTYKLPYTQDFQFIVLRVAAFAQDIRDTNGAESNQAVARAFAAALIALIEPLKPSED